MKSVMFFSLALALAGATPALAQAQIRQYQQQGVPTPYPNVFGDSQVGEPPPPPQVEQMAPQQVTPRNSPPIRNYPY